jgi:uncharacterized membrane protein
MYDFLIAYSAGVTLLLFVVWAYMRVDVKLYKTYKSMYDKQSTICDEYSRLTKELLETNNKLIKLNKDQIAYSNSLEDALKKCVDTLKTLSGNNRVSDEQDSKKVH